MLVLADLAVLITGVCEIARAFGLVTRSLRWWAGVMLVLYAVCVFPANVKHALRTAASATAVELAVPWSALRSSTGHHLVGPSIVEGLSVGRLAAASGCLVTISDKGSQNLPGPPSALGNTLRPNERRPRVADGSTSNTISRSVLRPTGDSASSAYQQAPELPQDEIAIL